MTEDTLLRDELARERTVLANERTLLAYGRTTLGLIGLAVVIFKFSDAGTAMIFGSLSLTLSVFVALWGVHSYRRVQVRLSGDITHTEKAFALAEID
jgi:putative membrane protein